MRSATDGGRNVLHVLRCSVRTAGGSCAGRTACRTGSACTGVASSGSCFGTGRTGSTCTGSASPRSCPGTGSTGSTCTGVASSGGCAGTGRTGNTCTGSASPGSCPGTGRTGKPCTGVASPGGCPGTGSTGSICTGACASAGRGETCCACGIFRSLPEVRCSPNCRQPVLRPVRRKVSGDGAYLPEMRQRSSRQVSVLHPLRNGTAEGIRICLHRSETQKKGE